MLLEKLQDNPSAIKEFSLAELPLLAKEIRQKILDTVLNNGGHLASSLGAVEIILAMHYVFDAKIDKFIFDVGHQSYAHKLLTGRLADFDSLRKKDGIAGFPKRCESEYDAVNTGHSSTSISVGTGFVKAKELLRADYEVISLIGDGAMTGGLAYEALNYSASANAKQIVLLNDNEMSISANVGSIAKYLLRLHGNNVYRNLKTKTNKIFNQIKIENEKRGNVLSTFKNSVKYFIQKGMPFEQFGYKYLGPIDGHNIEELITSFQIAKNEEDNVILHIITKKGKGVIQTEENPAKYHGYSPSQKDDNPNFSNEFGKCMFELAKNDDKIVCLTAAMSEGTGLKEFASTLPDRLIDVGIAEAQAVCMSSSLAIEGFKPYFAVYSSFLQRGYDQLLHDICLQKLPVRFCIDRSGIVPCDGETHQGIYDISYLRSLPNMNIVAPCDTDELKSILAWSTTFNKPLAIKYPKGNFKSVYKNEKAFELGQWNYLLKDVNAECVLLCAGALMVNIGEKVAKILLSKKIKCEVVNASSIKPLDKEFLLKNADKKLFTLEDNTINGGFGSAVLQFYAMNDTSANVTVFALDEDEVLTHATVDELLQMVGLDSASVADKILKKLRRVTQ